MLRYASWLVVEKSQARFRFPRGFGDFFQLAGNRRLLFHRAALLLREIGLPPGVPRQK